LQHLIIGLATDIGQVRNHNEDSVWCGAIDGSRTLCIVADGMGGHAAGEVASQLAIATVREVFSTPDVPDPCERLKRAIQAANHAIWERGNQVATQHGMGTTLTSALLSENRVILGHVGDSRAYLLRDSVLTQLTHDHSWVAEQVRAGLLTEEQARWHPYRNIITRALGSAPDVTVDMLTEPLLPGDTILLCSDGLSGQVTDEELRDVLLTCAPQNAVERLIEMANANGGPDNITAVVIHCDA